MSMKKLKLKWVSDTIGDGYKLWKGGDIVTIQAQTGTGKTYFIKSKLIPYAEYYEKILLLANRIELKRQLKIDLLKNMHEEIPESLEELDKMCTFGNVTIMSYQQLNYISHAEKYNQNKLNLNCYSYIICDECHFIQADSSFNNMTDYSLDNIIHSYDNAIKIFISATMEEVKPMIEKSYEKKSKCFGASKYKVYNYTTGIDYSYLDTSYFKTIKDIGFTIKNNESEDKWLVFVNKIDDAKTIKELIRDKKKVSIITKDTNDDNDDLQSIIKNSKFISDVLITTKALDNGVNIEDTNVKNIVIMALDRITFIQELGRLRMNIENPYKVNLYIRTKSKGTFTTLINMVYKKKFKIIDEFMGTKDGQTDKENKDSREVTYEKFCMKYNREYKKLPQDILYLDNEGKWNINPMGYSRLTKDNNFAEYMIEQFKNDYKFAFIKEQLLWLNLINTFNEKNLIENIIDKDDVDMLDKWIENHEGEKLFSDEQQELSSLIIKELVTVGNNVDYRTKKLKPSTIENILRGQLGLHYAVSKSKRYDKIIDGIRKTKSYIVITKIK